jgi:segregation and condensation protein B
MDEMNNTEIENIESAPEMIMYPNSEDLEYPEVELQENVEADQLEVQTEAEVTVEDIREERELDILCFADNIAEDDILYPQEEELAYPEVFELEQDFLNDEQQEDKLWQARTGLNFDTLCGAIETIIFMSDKPVSLAKIKALIDEDLPLRVVHSSLERLQEGYESAHHGLRLMEVAEGYQFRTKATYSKYVQDLFKINSLVLSPTALEVLAILSYKQPISKNEIEKIRGVDSSHIVRGLMDKRLVKVVGRSDEAGKPVLYGTTAEFLEVFNLADLSELPPEHELKEMTEQGIGKIGDIKTICAGDKDKFNFDEEEELELLAESIKAIASDTDFTKSLKVEEKKRTSATGEAIKSAFDLLEEHVTTREITTQNADALKSELMNSGILPAVISDLLEGWPFNAPEEDEGDFQMIDLDTGEAIEIEEDEIEIEFEGVEVDADGEVVAPEDNAEEDDADIEQATLIAALNAENSMEQISTPDTSQESTEEAVEENPVEEVKVESTQKVEEAVDLFKVDENEDEVSALAAALDKAFANLTGESLDEDAVELKDTHDIAEEKANDLDDLTDSIVEKAEDLDIDLSFLKDDSVNTSEIEN